MTPFFYIPSGRGREGEPKEIKIQPEVMVVDKKTGLSASADYRPGYCCLETQGDSTVAITDRFRRQPTGDKNNQMVAFGSYQCPVEVVQRRDNQIIASGRVIYLAEE